VDGTDKTVLVVDDDPDMRIVLRRQLEALGFAEIRAVPGARAAQAVIAREPLALALIDITFHPVGGLELVKAIRRDSPESHRRLPILLMSANCDPQTGDEARDAGANGLIAKPFRLTELSAAIAQVLCDARAFIVAPDYVGPDRRCEEPAGYDRADRRARAVLGASCSDELVESGPIAMDWVSDVLF
jgi:CheY-like chemotaxis protein